MKESNNGHIFNNAVKALFLITSFSLTLLMNLSCALSDQVIGRSKEAYMVSQLKLEIEIDKKSYKLEEAIAINCTIKNIGSDLVNLHPILFDDIVIYVKHEDEFEPRVLGSFIFVNEIWDKEDIIALQPDEAHFFKKIVNKGAYSMPTKIGEYELYIIYWTGLKELDKIKLWTGRIESNTVQFEITKK